MTVTELFKQECTFLRTEHNYSDCLVYPYISETDMVTVRTKFSIEDDDTILLIRDTSFWNSRNKGLVVTDSGFYYIWDNNDPEPFIRTWEDLVDVYYQDLCLYFKELDFEDNEYEFEIEMDNFIKSSDDNHKANIGKKLVPVFKKIIKCVEGSYHSLDELKSQGKYQEAIERCFECLNNDDIVESKETFYYHIISESYAYLNDWKKSLEYAQKGINKWDEAFLESEDILSLLYKEDSEDIYNTKLSLLSDLYNAYQQLGLNSLARRECLSVIMKATNQTNCDIKDDAVKNFSKIDEEYRNEFFTLPYNERKVIMPVRQYVNLYQECVAVIDIQNMPAISFPMGHPIANQLYVGHPLIPSKYIPFENYQLELVEDKVREFCVLAQNLGATEISIECLNSASTDQNNNSQLNASSGVHRKYIAEANGTIQKDGTRHMIDELSRSINLHQTFVPHNKPTIPEGMVWYDNEPSWQRLVSQRLNGNLTSHEERIETKKSQMVEGRELLDIKAEIKTLFADMDMTMDKTEESKFTQQENAVLSIKVKFAPISQLTGETSATPVQIASASTSALNSIEEEYLTELKEILADGEISPRERRLLEKIRIQSGISEERAAELENSLTALKLTKEEQEYLDEYKDVIADGEITEKARRLLDKFRKLNGISEERAKEIEASVKR